MNQKTAKRLRKFAKQRMNTPQTEEVFYNRSKRKYKGSKSSEKRLMNEMLKHETGLHK